MFAGWASTLFAHDIYLMNSNHADYNWDATAAEYDASMLVEIDYYLQQIADTAGAPANEQSRYAADGWWWLYLYEHNRSPEAFANLIGAMRSGHITIPLNPFEILYGAMPTEAAIRAGYYPARIARRFGLDLPIAEYRENDTMPWGLASIWAGSGVSYTWKGICGCVQYAPPRVDDELFVWQGPDGKTLLFKWYNLLGSNRDWGGYSEARDNLSDPGELDAQMARSRSRMPDIPVTGLFGAGWNDVSWETTAVLDAVTAYNDTDTGDTAISSNGVDFFRALEASGSTSRLRTLRGGWGNDWDMWPASLAERTARARRALERMHTAEPLATWAQRYDPGFWPPVRESLDLGLVAAWKYFEHGWSVADTGPTLAEMVDDKKGWVDDLEGAVDGAVSAADDTISTLFATPAEDRVAVFNPLGFERTDVAEIEVGGPGPYTVTDVSTDLEVPNQLITGDGSTRLQFVASYVPSLGYKLYRLTAGQPSAAPDAATVTPTGRTIENAAYRVVLGDRGQIVHAVAKKPDREVELAGAEGMNDFGSGVIETVTAEDVGPVSATLRVDLSDPQRTVRITLYSAVDRIDISDSITENQSGLHTYSFQTALAGAQIHFEEVGAIARPGTVSEGGDFLQGTRASRMTLNHFVDFALPDYNLVLSNWDAFAMQVNDSTNSDFDLNGDTVHVVVTEQGPGATIADQGSDAFFLNRFALRGIAGSFDGAEAMRTAFAHQNPLHVVALPRNHDGQRDGTSGSLLSIDAEDVVVTAFKPAEDPGAGFIVRLWELGGTAATVDIDASGLDPVRARATSLVETDVSSAPLANGVISEAVDANAMATIRIDTLADTTRVRRVGRRVPDQ